MMHFPVVGRAAFDVLERENGWLREQLTLALDHNRRLERRERGLNETAPQPRRTPDPIPPDLRQLIAQFDNSTVRKNLERQVRERKADGYEWPEIAAEIIKAMPPDGDDE